MVEALATFAVEEILKKVISLAAQEINLVWGFEQDLKKLVNSLLSVQALLQDVGEKQIESMSIRGWMQKLQNWAYYAEDVLDEFGYELLHQKIGIQIQLKKVSSFFSAYNPILFRFKMAHKLKSINEELENIRTESSDLKLVPLRYVEIKIEVTDSYLDNSEIVVGRNEEVFTILNMITQKSSSICVVPIVGMPGLGKTTLARLLSKKVEENKLFDERMWMCVSNTFDEEKILRGMLQSLDSTVGAIDHIDATVKHLRKKLRNKSFFLVLDDVWNEEEHIWKSLMNRLLKINRSRKNCIVITTRSERVASITETTPMHRYYPTKLSNDECWSIIKEKVVGKTFKEIPQDLKDIGKDIAKKCAGLPLLARVLGGTMQTSADWSSIRDSKVWSTLTKDNEILHVLKLSFDRLPSSSLKQCFAYCAIFPEDYVIEKSKLIQLWIAQGYLHHERNITADDVGEKYYKILLANSFFQDVLKDKFGNILSCTINDAVHGLAAFVSRSEIWISNSMAMNDMANIRHIRLKQGEILTKLEKNSCQKIRSLFSDVEVGISTLRGLKRIRVLDIRGSSTTDLSTTFVEAKHLRYLDISESTISIQPRWIAKLSNLQTLRLVNYRGPMKPLAGVEHLLNLKHIIFNDPDLTPSHIGKLTCLQTLSIFAVGTKKGHGIKELGSLKHLRGELNLQKLENVKGKLNADEANIEGKPKLQNLSYVWSRRTLDTRERNDAKDVLEGLKPHRDLVGLNIFNFDGESFSSWLSDHDLLGRLRRLELIGCQNCIELPTLGEMSCLENLVMRKMENLKRIGIEFYSRVDLASAANVVTLFPALIKLQIDGMSKLEEWVEPIAEGITIFPSLEDLSVEYCDNLTRIPTIQSKSFTKLEIRWCPKLMSIPVIQSKSLRKLDIEYCHNLSSCKGVNGSGLVDLLIHNSGISILPAFSNSLQNINIYGLPDLTIIPESLGDLTCLVEIYITNCEALTSMPIRLQSCKSLKILSIIDCEKLENVPENLREMSFLETLWIRNCPKVIRVVNIPISHQCLKSLLIGGFIEMDEFPNLDDGVNSSVEFFALIGWYGLMSIPYIRHFTHLKILYIYSFDEVEVLPEWLGNLSSLVKLEIQNCKILRSLPESMTRLTNLKKISIRRCPCLAAKLSSDTTEYSKISHIESISIDYVAKGQSQFGPNIGFEL